MNKGFTLIELLLVIAIIGILSVTTVVNLRAAKDKATNARIISEFEQFEKGLELFYWTYGRYPCGDNEYNSEYSVDHAADEFGFLHGNYSGPGFGDINCDNNPSRGLDLVGAFDDEFWHDIINHPKWISCGGGHTNPCWPWNYMYTVSASSEHYYDSYILHTVLVGDDPRSAHDGGLCDNHYEIGPGVGTIMPWGSASALESLTGIPCN